MSENTAYWLRHALEGRQYWILKHVAGGCWNQGRQGRDLFDEAYLISLKCLKFDGTKLEITDKGRDALNFFREDFEGDAT